MLQGPRPVGLAWKVVRAEQVLVEAIARSRRFAIHPLDSLVESKRMTSATFALAVAAGAAQEKSALDPLPPGAGEPRRR